jgi:hypothetical protein
MFIPGGVDRVIYTPVVPIIDLGKYPRHIKCFLILKYNENYKLDRW